ncbi:hypothetical protein [Salinibacterium sp.]|uniref:hypothetical protein n=1 Tax=Salinibacterium sp. TaxID=1915057 RepID=UPI00286CB0CE|nr:hypothetical protein [Salinibacterium sp.]
MFAFSEKLRTETVAGDSRVIALTRRVAVGLGLASIAAIHILDIPGKFAETPYLAGLYLALIVAAFVVMERLFVAGNRRDFVASAALSLAVIAGFVVNRTVGMPGAMDDIGNWLEPLGLLSLVVEGFVVWQSIAAVVGMTRTPR